MAGAVDPRERQGRTIAEHLSADQLASCPEHFLDPISLDLMADPVMLVPTTQLYDYHSLMTWFESGGRSCPLTGLQLGGKVTLRVRSDLRDEICAWLRQQGVDADAVRAAVMQARHSTEDHGREVAFKQSRRARDAQRLQAVLSAIINFLGSGTKFYETIH